MLLKEADRMKHLIEELMFHAKLPSLNMTDVNIRALFEELIHDMKSKRKDIQFTINIPPLCIIRADRDKINQAFFNLLDNAIDAAKKTVTISAFAEDGNIKVIIADDGEGIKKEYIDRIFDPFFTTKKAGTGLGLSICTKIIEDHGGTIEVKSSENEGTAMILTLKEK